MDEFYLERFIKAHEMDYEMALKEIRNGHKQNHWMWYIFPQIIGLGSSSMSSYYAIKSVHEAKAYLENDILRNHLIEISEVLLKQETDNILNIMDKIDSLKLQACMTLFHSVDPTIDVFTKVLNKYFQKEDYRTLVIIKSLK